MRPSQLAINSVSTRHESLPQMLDAYRAAGFANVEFQLGHVKQFLEAGHTPNDARRLLDERRMRCIGGFEGTVRAFGDEAERRANHDAVVANAELIAALGGATMVVGTDGPGADASADQAIDGYVETFAALGQSVQHTGVTVCIEFNWSPLIKSLRTAAEIARRSGSDHVGVLFDPAHYHCTPTKFEQLTPANVASIRHVHVDDMADKPGELSHCNADRALPGEGHLDLPALFGRIEGHGYDGYFAIEMFSEALWRLDTQTAAERMYQSLLPLCAS